MTHKQKVKSQRFKSSNREVVTENQILQYIYYTSQ